jgi:peptide deformylase
MNSLERIRQIDLPNLRIIHYPDPRLAEVSVPLEEIDAKLLTPLIKRMFELMFEAKGVGLAAPQVGLNVRMFVASPTCETGDLRVYINPRIVGAEDWVQEEEGCLSVPDIQVSVRRHRKVTIEATNLKGEVFQETGVGLLARIFQHETDHLDGMLIVNRMGTVAKLANRRTIRELEDKFAESKKA